jgi:hypothetical protein
LGLNKPKPPDIPVEWDSNGGVETPVPMPNGETLLPNAHPEVTGAVKPSTAFLGVSNKDIFGANPANISDVPEFAFTFTSAPNIYFFDIDYGDGSGCLPNIFDMSEDGANGDSVGLLKKDISLVELVLVSKMLGFGCNSDITFGKGLVGNAGGSIGGA